MQCFRAAINLLLPLAACQTGPDTASRTRLQSVIALIEDMSEKGREAKQQEATLWATYKTQFCDVIASSKAVEIEAATTQITVLEAEVERWANVASQLGRDVKKAEEGVSAWEHDTVALEAAHTKETAENNAAIQDHLESVYALEGAIQTLPAHDEGAIQTEHDEDVTEADPADETSDALAYDYQSGDIRGTLEDLLVKFKDELAAVKQKTVDDEGTYTTRKKQLEDDITSTKSSIRVNEAELKRVLGEKADDEAELVETQNKQQLDIEYLDHLRSTCTSKASAFESRQALRAEELDTFSQVLNILQSDTVSSRDLVQAGGAALAALRGAVAGDGDQQQRVLDFLTRRASALKSTTLEGFASHIGQSGPFTNVKKMVQDLIERLEKEARSDADHEYMCQRELRLNEESRTSKESNAKRLESDIGELNGKIQIMTTEIEELKSQVGDRNADLKKATVVRESENAGNLATIKDAVETQKALADAITFLTDFYNKAGTATAFAHIDTDPIAEAPDFDSPYKGMQAEGSNVDAFLKVLLSDFAKLERETQTQERKAAAEHEFLDHETKLSITSLTKDIEYKTKESTAASTALSTAETDFEANAKALSLANEEYDALKPQCVYVDYEGRHEDRVAQRKLEVQSLEQALDFLRGGSTDALVGA